MGAPDYAKYAKQHEKQRKQLVTEGEFQVGKAYEGYTPEWYQGRSNAYQAYARPQLAQQYQTTRNAQLFGLANKGNLGGSASQQGFANINRANLQAQQGIVDAGRSYAQDLERQVQANKQNMLGMVYTASDPANATMQATQAAASFKPNNVMQPVANMFGDIANTYYMNQLMSQYRQGQQNTGAPGYYGGSSLPPTVSSR